MRLPTEGPRSATGPRTRQGSERRGPQARESDERPRDVTEDHAQLEAADCPRMADRRQVRHGFAVTGSGRSSAAGAARGSAQRALRGRDAHLEGLLLLDDDAAPAAAPAHQRGGCQRSRGANPTLNPKGYSQAVSHACIIHVCHTGYMYIYIYIYVYMFGLLLGQRLQELDTALLLPGLLGLLFALLLRGGTTCLMLLATCLIRPQLCYA